MPRGPRKVRNYENELQDIDAKIERKTREIENLKAKKVEIENERDKQNLQKILDSMHEAGMSVDDVVTLIHNK